MFRSLGKSPFVLKAAGSLLAGYLRLVQRTNRAIILPEQGEAMLEASMPVIVTMWHGQHFMQSFFKKPHHRVHVMISRSGDGQINAIAAEKLGIGTVRGSGAQRADQVRKRGGVQALRALLDLLAAGENVALTADVPKVSRVAGEGIITLAQLSGRPILPVAVVCSRRIDFKSWDASSLGLPFGKTAVVFAEPVHVARDADAEAREAMRRLLENRLDAAYADGYAAFGQTDPGAGRESVIAARTARAADFPAEQATHDEG